MKKTDLEKNLGLKIAGKLKQSAGASHFGTVAHTPDRREQRKQDQARGLIPFAVKLDSQLAAEVRTLAESRQTDLNELVAELLRKGLAG